MSKHSNNSLLSRMTLIRDIDSQKGLYAEAVLLGSRYQGLFRVIPTRYILALLLE